MSVILWTCGGRTQRNAPQPHAAITFGLGVLPTCSQHTPGRGAVACVPGCVRRRVARSGRPGWGGAACVCMHTAALSVILWTCRGRTQRNAPQPHATITFGLGALPACSPSGLLLPLQLPSTACARSEHAQLVRERCDPSAQLSQPSTHRLLARCCARHLAGLAGRPGARHRRHWRHWERCELRAPAAAPIRRLRPPSSGIWQAFETEGGVASRTHDGGVRCNVLHHQRVLEGQLSAAKAVAQPVWCVRPKLTLYPTL
jgi:hypothetical protein